MKRLRDAVDNLPYQQEVRGWRSVLGVVGSTASLLALIASAASLTWLSDQIWPILITLWLLGFTSHLVWKIRRLRESYYRRARYALVLDSLHNFQHSIRNSEWLLLEEHASPATVLPALRDALTSVGTGFSIATAAPCRVCIKAVAAPLSAASNEDLGKLMVRVLCRDSHSTGGQPDDDSYPITSSTAFESLVDNRNRIRWWFSNDLLAERYYKNKSIPDGGNAADLSYRSTAVWPIRKANDVPGEVDDLRGFLCIDSPVEGIFDPRFDFGLGAQVADSLYTTLRLLTQGLSDGESGTVAVLDLNVPGALTTGTGGDEDA